MNTLYHLSFFLLPIISLKIVKMALIWYTFKVDRTFGLIRNPLAK